MPKKKMNSTDFFGKVGDVVLGKRTKGGQKKAAEKPKPKQSKGPRQEIPKRLQGFFENRHAGWPEYVMLKVQLLILALFVVAVVYLVFLPEENLILIALLTIFSAGAVHMSRTQLKNAFKRDYPAYRSFVFMCIAVAWVFVIILKFSTFAFTAETLQLILIPPIIAISCVAIAFLAFRLKYGRNFTYGKIEESSGRRAVVRIGYDIRSNVKAGLYHVESFTKVKRGDTVKVNVERPMLGLRGAKVRAIMERSK